MINTITICPDGHLIPESDCLGRTGEHNATVLKFDFFEDLNGKSASEFEKFVVALFPEGEKPYAITGNRFELPSELTVYTEIILRVDMKIGNDVIFRTEPRLFILEDSDITPSYQKTRHPLIGDINRLNTEDKKNLVNAINEVLRIAHQNDSDIRIEDLAEKITGTVNMYDPQYYPSEQWADSSKIDNSGSLVSNNEWCVTPFIGVINDYEYKISPVYDGNIYLYDDSYNFVEYIAVSDYLKTPENVSYIRLNVPKRNSSDTIENLETTIDNFNSIFGIYAVDHYKIKNNVLLPDNIKIPSGVSITSIEQTVTSTEDGGNNVITITLSDGETLEFIVKNGNKGNSGIYVGSGDMPDGYNIQIDPDGEAVDFPTREEFGSLEKLKTENKDSIVDAINELVGNSNFGTESVPGGSEIPITDPTLTKEGVAADAKAVGDKFKELDIKLCEIIGSGVLV